MRRSLSLGLVGAYSLALGCSGCMAPRDFHHPGERVTLNTAYTLDHRQVRIDLGGNASGPDKFGANFGVAVGFGRHAQIESNLAHAALGLPNARIKYNFLDRPRIALSAETGLAYTSPKILWALPDETREQLGDLDVFSVPIVARATVPIVRWFDLSVGLGYTAAIASGTVEDDVTVYEGTIGPRSLYFEPQLTFYPNGFVAVFAGAHLPPYTAVVGELIVTETVAPGVAGGLRTVDWEPVPFSSVVSAHAGVELRFGRRTHLQLFVSHNAVARFVGAPILPGFNFYWRLP